jgi:hypothetical protein
MYPSVFPCYLVAKKTILAITMTVAISSQAQAQAELNKRSDPFSIDLVDRLSAAYVALPVLIFFATWFRPLIGAALILLVLFGLMPLFAASANKRCFGLSSAGLAVAIIVALGWTSLGGAGHFVYANSDWVVRDAVLRDLAVSSWPPGYGVLNGSDLILRCPVAYYLPAALLAKIIGPAYADFLLFVWTAIGVMLFFMMALSRLQKVWQLLLAATIIVFFSGMDILGIMALGHSMPSPAIHLEWWAQLFQYSSNTTLLFWVPNHALSGWIIAALFFKHWRNPQFLKFGPSVLALTALWSPLVTIGFAPFAGFLAWHHLRHGTWRDGWAPLSWLSAVGIFVTIAIYITMDGAGIRSGWTISLAMTSGEMMLLHHVFFILFEFGIITILLWRIRRDVLLIVAGVTLALLPLYTFGPGNDLAMRASIPALTILCLVAVDALCEIDLHDWSTKDFLLVLCLLIGAVTPIHEIARALLFARWKPELGKSLVEVEKTLPAHYVGRLNMPLLEESMRQPSSVPAFPSHSLDNRE